MEEISIEGSYNIANLDQLASFAKTIAGQIGAGDTLLLSGELGAGKTAFTQALGKALGVSVPITSPTYTLMGEYAVPGHGAISSIMHIDLYRTGESDVLTMNNNYVQEMLDTAKQKKSVVVIEWGELLSVHPRGRTWKLLFTRGQRESERIVRIDRMNS